MRSILETVDRWRAEGRGVVVARVVGTDGSGPRDAGAAMAVNDAGEVVGSVSGGCVEAAVVTEAMAVAASGDRRVVSFGFSDDEAFAVGLTCGGTVHLCIEPLDWPLYEQVRDGVADGLAFALVTCLSDGPEAAGQLVVHDDGTVTGSLGDPELDRVVARDAIGELEAGRAGLRHYGLHGEAGEDAVTVFVDCFVAPPRMFVFGAVDFTTALVRVAKVLGYVVTVCDAREVFATPIRFPEADEVVVDWPHRLLARIAPPLGARDAVCVLTHDHKFDVPAIVAALASDVGYLGAMGSRRTHAERVERLRAEGVSDASLARVMAPIGLDLGGRTPEETAVAICAEIIARRTGRSGSSLRDVDGDIHAR